MPNDKRADQTRQEDGTRVIRCLSCDAAQPNDDETGACVVCGMPLIQQASDAPAPTADAHRGREHPDLQNMR